MRRKYIKQKDNFSCGAISLLNALIWSGKKVSPAYDLARLAGECGINSYGLHDQKRFEKTLKNEGKKLKIKKKFKPQVDEIIRHMESNGSVIIKFAYPEEENDVAGHIAFVEEYKNGFFKIINFNLKYTESFLTKSEFEKECLLSFNLGKTAIDKYPYVWFLSKNNYDEFID